MSSPAITVIKGSLLERLNRGPVLAAEGYLFELERRGLLKAGAFVPEVVLENPEALREVHREFVNAGSEVVEAFTYYAHRDKLRVIGRENDLEPLNRQALKIAKEVAQEAKETKGLDVLVAGNICNTWVYDHNNAEESGKIVRQMYEEQVGWAKEAGVDFVIAETISFLGEALIALEVIKKHGLPSVITFAILEDKSQDGYDWVEACQILEKNGADVVGFNCFRGPAQMLPYLRKLRSKVKCYIAAQPVPYRTTDECPTFTSLKDDQGKHLFPLRLDTKLLDRFEMADFATEAKELGVNYIGVCCGCAPIQIRQMAENLGRVVPASRFTADMSKHGMLGSDETVKPHQKKFKSQWN
ncbi:Homocysteine methyltransferase [Aphelenchoides besseyi]|nr:Homocysteine methyltransferase [Aphelenchoides besseyi]KAI6208735.1 Homocysteine methyltransferase [Aphelenchoides besseyi]